jgi:hypothetical protein
LHVLVTQPEYTVVDDFGDTYAGSDGFEVHIAIPEADLYWERIARLPLNLHANEEQRRWHRLLVDIPPGSKAVGIELYPGTVIGGNNSWDRVWVSVQEPLKFVNAFSEAGRAILEGEQDEDAGDRRPGLGALLDGGSKTQPRPGAANRNRGSSVGRP